MQGTGETSNDLKEEKRSKILSTLLSTMLLRFSISAFHITTTTIFAADLTTRTVTSSDTTVRVTATYTIVFTTVILF